MLFQEFNKIAVLIPQVAIHPRTCRAGLHTGRCQPFFKPVIAQCAFISNFLDRMNKPASIRTCLNTVPAADAILLINKHHSLGTIISGTNRANLYTGRLSAMIAHFRHKKGFEDLLIGNRLLETIDTSVRGYNCYTAVIFDGILFHPGTKVKWFCWHVILAFAGFCTASATDAFLNIYYNAVPWQALILWFRSI